MIAGGITTPDHPATARVTMLRGRAGRGGRKHPLLWDKFQIDDEDLWVFDFYWVAIETGCSRDDIRVRAGGRGGGRRVKLARLIMGAGPSEFVDHINGDPLDNRRINLRLCSRAENARNRRAQKDGTSHFKGVWFVKRRSTWGAGISIDGQTRHIGYFANEADAAAAYDNAARRLYGEFAALNFPDMEETPCHRTPPNLL